MPKRKQYDCYACGAVNIAHNDVGLNKKLLGEGVERFMCIDCLASYLEATVDDLRDKVEEFKAEGCKLFG